MLLAPRHTAGGAHPTLAKRPMIARFSCARTQQMGGCVCPYRTGARYPLAASHRKREITRHRSLRERDSWSGPRFYRRREMPASSPRPMALIGWTIGPFQTQRIPILGASLTCGRPPFPSRNCHGVPVRPSIADTW